MKCQKDPRSKHTFQILLGNRHPQLRLHLGVEVSQRSELALSLRKGLVMWMELVYIVEANQLRWNVSNYICSQFTKYAHRWS